MDTLRLALLEQMLVSVSSLLLQSVLMLQELLNAFGQFGCGLEHTPSQSQADVTCRLGTH